MKNLPQYDVKFSNFKKEMHWGYLYTAQRGARPSSAGDTRY